MNEGESRRMLGAIRDRQEIEEALARYSRGLDHRDWAEWEGLFTDDARLDYSPIGLGVLTPTEFRDHVSGNDGVRVGGQHLHSNLIVAIDDDVATVRAEFTMVNVVRDEDPRTGTMVRAGGDCRYELARTDGRWCIRGRSAWPTWKLKDVIPL